VACALTIYALGVAVGLLFTDARPLTRTVIALAWPLGPLAFAVTIAVLLVAGMFVFPAFGIAVVVAVAAGWLWFS
jgi:hypothetical protein